MKKIGVIGEGENPTPEAAMDALADLNDLIAIQSLEGDAVYQQTVESFALTQNIASYTIGPGAAFSTVRPTRILTAYLSGPGDDVALDPLDAEDYAAIGDKAQSRVPRFFWYDGGYPAARIVLDSLPPAGYTLNLVTEKPIARIPTLDTELSFPPGYEPFYLFNLAVVIAPDYEIQAPADVRGEAARTKIVIENSNALKKNDEIEIDEGLLSIGRIGRYRI